MIHLILLTILIAAAFAIYEAWLIVKRTKAGEREDLDHAELMGWRAAAWIVVAILLMAFDVVTLRGVLWSIVPCLAAFAITHRFTLNKARKIPWWWMGWPIGFRPDNASRYDDLWHLIARRLGSRKPHSLGWKSTLPAKLAYGFEASVIVVTVLLHHLP